MCVPSVELVCAIPMWLCVLKALLVRRCRYTPVVYYNMCVRVLRVWFASRPAAVVSCVWVIRNDNSNKYANPENSTTGVYIIYVYIRHGS